MIRLLFALAFTVRLTPNRTILGLMAPDTDNSTVESYRQLSKLLRDLGLYGAARAVGSTCYVHIHRRDVRGSTTGWFHATVTHAVLCEYRGILVQCYNVMTDSGQSFLKRDSQLRDRVKPDEIGPIPV